MHVQAESMGVHTPSALVRERERERERSKEREREKKENERKRERERVRKRKRERESEKEGESSSLTRNKFFNCPELLFLLLKKVTEGALAPFSYLIYNKE
jgi:hypothetical protein